MIFNQNDIVVLIVMVLVCAIPLVKYPEFTLAIILNGTFVYLYLVFKLEFSTTTLLTGFFYGGMMLCSLIGVFFSYKRTSNNVKFIYTDYLFILFFFMIFVSFLMFSFDNQIALKRIYFAPFMTLGPYIAIRFLNSKESIDKFITNVAFIPIALMIPAFYELFTNPMFLEYQRFSMYYFHDRGDNPILFGITFSVFVIILFSYIIEQKKYYFKAFLIAGPALYLIFRSGSRGATLSLILSLFLYTLILVETRLRNKIFIIAITFLSVMGVIYSLPQETLGFYQYSFSYEAREQEGSSIFERINLWEMALKDFSENFFTGVGFGNSLRGIGYPHNLFLEIGAEFGLIGIMVLFLILIPPVRKAYFIIKSNKFNDYGFELKVSFILFIYFLIEAMFSGFITQQTGLFMSLGLLVSVLSRLQFSALSKNESK